MAGGIELRVFLKFRLKDQGSEPHIWNKNRLFCKSQVLNCILLQIQTSEKILSLFGKRAIYKTNSNPPLSANWESLHEAQPAIYIV